MKQTNAAITYTEAEEILGPLMTLIPPETMTQCLTKEVLTSNWLVDEAKLTNYTPIQLVRYQDIVKASDAEWSNTFATTFIDSWGNDPISRQIITIEAGSAKLYVDTMIPPYYPDMKYSAGTLFETCTTSTLECDVLCTTKDSKHGHLFCIEDIYADQQSVIGFSLWINQNASSAQERNRPLVIGNISNSKTFPLNEWHHVKLTYNWDSGQSQAWLNGVDLGTRINTKISRFNKIIRFGYKNNDCFKGNIKNVRITTT